MSRLFAGLYLDEDVSVLVGDLLRARGFQATTTRDAGRLGSKDAEQMEYAASHGLALLTHNRSDFEDLHRQYLAEKKGHGGIIIASQRRPHLTVANLLRLLNKLTAAELRDQLLYV
ncbi:MAG: DUF5615 family PIN-like protein [Chloroflexi bacterium]|nr:DUF5615 family PIN-like protein [Chloroflexota bacterium]MBI4288341.1 DUF5615 family PIN-like protein [Chloroflexota bacterium]